MTWVDPWHDPQRSDRPTVADLANLAQLGELVLSSASSWSPRRTAGCKKSRSQALSSASHDDTDDSSSIFETCGVFIRAAGRFSIFMATIGQKYSFPSERDEALAKQDNVRRLQREHDRLEDQAVDDDAYRNVVAFGAASVAGAEEHLEPISHRASATAAVGHVADLLSWEVATPPGEDLFPGIAERRFQLINLDLLRVEFCREIAKATEAVTAATATLPAREVPGLPHRPTGEQAAKFIGVGPPTLSRWHAKTPKWVGDTIMFTHLCEREGGFYYRDRIERLARWYRAAAVGQYQAPVPCP